MGQEAGLIGPRLVGNDFLTSAGAIIGQIMVGNPEHGMPPFANQLNDREIAAISTYVRNSWGNDYGIVTEQAVAIRRPN
jgi:mono/diheme cytochrome c family protein